MRAILAMLALLALGCRALDAHELRLEAEQTLAVCAEQRVDTSLCLDLELIQAEYELCLRTAEAGVRCEDVWQDVAELEPPMPVERPFLLRRALLGAP
jgi:hypothetical protein